MLNWQMDAAAATVISSVAIVASAIFVVFQLRQAARDRYVAITSELFHIWQSPEFQEDQLFLLHKLPATSWEEFAAGGRGERAERALHRICGFYDRVGNLIKNRLIRQDDILPTIGGSAIATWHRVEPIVNELRRRENAFLFQNFETVLPNCRECYVPSLAQPPTLEAPTDGVERIGPRQAQQLLKRSGAVVLDVSKQASTEKIKNAVRTDPNDLSGWLTVVSPAKDVVTYCT